MDVVEENLDLGECAKQIGTYVGMVPSEDSSAGKQRLGHISKQGNSLLRFLLVEAAVRSNPEVETPLRVACRWNVRLGSSRHN